MNLSVREHDTLLRGPATVQGEEHISVLGAEAFDAVQALVLDKAGELGEVATPTKHAGRDALKLTQWVGLIRTPDGTAIEILPKTHERPGSRQQDAEESLHRSRALLMRMLSATDERFRMAPAADLDPARMPLFELLLRVVLEGVKEALRRGLPHTYVHVQEERAGLRGRVDLPRQLRQPAHRLHLLHVAYDEFLPDRPETRLVRLAVERVLRLTRVEPTKRLARELLLALEDVPPSRNVDRDFAQWRLERGHASFAPLEGLTRLVLYELNPLVGGQTARTQAVLFDMNKVYEAYVAHLLRLQQPTWRVETQLRARLGRAGSQGAFTVKPDLLITLPSGEKIVADTKWKRLKPGDGPTYGISNADIYQMLAYHQVFQGGQAGARLWLIYPHLPQLGTERPGIVFPLDQRLHVVSVDLEDPAGPWYGVGHQMADAPHA